MIGSIDTHLTHGCDRERVLSDLDSANGSIDGPQHVIVDNICFRNNSQEDSRASQPTRKSSWHPNVRQGNQYRPSRSPTGHLAVWSQPSRRQSRSANRRIVPSARRLPSTPPAHHYRPLIAPVRRSDTNGQVPKIHGCLGTISLTYTSPASTSATSCTIAPARAAGLVAPA